jgi:hypothetical protein
MARSRHSAPAAKQESRQPHLADFKRGVSPITLQEPSFDQVRLDEESSFAISE